MSTLPLPRYLVSFDTRKLPVEDTDVLIIGSGVAGLSVAIEAAQGGKRVLILNKAKELEESNTRYAQGGIAAELSADPETIKTHLSDTIIAGDGLCDQAVAQVVVSGGADTVEFLQNCGCNFDLTKNGTIARGTEAAHSRARILHAGGDKTGLELQRCLVKTATENEFVRTYTNCYAIDLLTSEASTSPRRRRNTGSECIGALVYYRGEVRAIFASVVVLATGGIGAMYRESSNPPIATGDGHAMALRAGVVLRDLEMVQFHPTIFYVAGAPRVLITEAVRGAGAILRNAAGERFMERHDKRRELAPRDIVSRAITDEMRNTGEACVFLDVTHLEQDNLAFQFPGFATLCEKYAIDISRSWVPVRPGPHYMIGGIRSDVEGWSSMPGLLAVGEAASSGLHGANRLASNSLLEGVVLGRKTGMLLARQSNGPVRPHRLSGRSHQGERPVDFEDLRNTLRTLMWRCMGAERKESGMKDLLRRIGDWQELIANTTLGSPTQWAVANMLHLAKAMTESALFRCESRGVHYRYKYPERDPSLKGKHVEYAAGRAPGYNEA